MSRVISTGSLGVTGRGEVLERLRDGCRRWGFDLVQPLQVGWYNDGVDGPLRLEDFGCSEHLAVVVGNTRALWPVWRSALARDAELVACADPLDAYTCRALNDIVSGLEPPVSLRFAHEGGDRRIAVQRLAHVAGLAYLTETHASVHPIYGPWVALRAVVSLAVVGPVGPPPALAHPCGACSRGCWPAFERALVTLDGAPSEANLRAHWQTWLAWRDACPVGREHRYSEAQIRYHYLRELGLDGPGDSDTQTDPARGIDEF
jgi:cyanocobalamin reductase (cyanide-eliminating) / alkylcobalamin dealkylase